MNKNKTFIGLVVCAIFILSCQPKNVAVVPPVVSTVGPVCEWPCTEEDKLTAVVMFATSTAEQTDIAPTTNGPTLANCPMFPSNNIWNRRVDSLPTHPMSDAWIDSIGSAESFHMDFGSGTWDGGPIGISFNVISGSTCEFNW